MYITYCWPFCNSFGDNFDCHGVVNVLKGLLSKGSSVSVWLLNKLFNMETIIQNQGLQHIVEKSLMCIDKNCINSFRLVNNDCKGIIDSSRNLRKSVSDTCQNSAAAIWGVTILKIWNQCQNMWIQQLKTWNASRLKIKWNMWRFLMIRSGE